MKSIQSIRRGERLTILILIVFFLGMGVLVWKVVKESSFYMSHSDDVTLGMVYDRNNQILFDPNASTETYDENYFLDVGNVIGDDSGQMTNTLVSENIEKLQNYSFAVFQCFRKPAYLSSDRCHRQSHFPHLRSNFRHRFL